MKALVLGVGRMGTTIASAMDYFGFHVVGMDTNPKAVDNMPRKVNYEQTEDEEGNKTIGAPRNEFFIVEDADDICRGIAAQEKPDVVKDFGDEEQENNSEKKLEKLAEEKEENKEQSEKEIVQEDKETE